MRLKSTAPTRRHFPTVHKTQVLLFNPNGQTRPNGLMTSSLKKLFQRQSVLTSQHSSTTSHNMQGTRIRDECALRTTSLLTTMTSTRTDRILPSSSPSWSQTSIGMNGTSKSLLMIERRARHHMDQCYKVAIRHHHIHRYHQETAHEDPHGSFRGTLMSAGNRSQSSASICTSQSC